MILESEPFDAACVRVRFLPLQRLSVVFGTARRAEILICDESHVRKTWNSLTTVSRALFLDVLHQVIKYNKKYKIIPKQMQKQEKQTNKSNIIVFTCYKQYVGIIQLLNVMIVYISG